MSDFRMYLQEREKIDFFVQNGYAIKRITENLNGAFIEFENNQKEEQIKTIHLLTAEARKYVSVKLLESLAKQ